MKVRLMRWRCYRTISIFMILRTKPRIRDQQCKLTFSGFWVSLLCGAVCTAVSAAPPTAPAPGPGPAPAPVPPPVSAPAPPPDEGFLEFLGSDDVGDAAWWEFLKRAPPRGNDPPAPPPQDAKK